MKKYKLKKKYLIPIIVLTSLITFIIIFGTSYAFFTASVTSKDFVITTGNLKLNYTKTGNVVNLSNTYPLTNTQGLATTGYTFNITNNGSIDTKYQIRLEIDSNNTIPLEYVKMAYVKTKENNTDTNNSISEPILLSNLDATNTFIKNQLINPTKTDSYTLKFWIDFSAPNDIQGKTFKATIVIDSIQNVEDGYVFNSTAPIITLNKFSDGNTDKHLLIGETFSDPGILSINDDKDLLNEDDVDITYEYTSDGNNISVVNNVNTNVVGIYYINYQVTDSANNTTTAIRTVTINNTPSIPTISLVGNSSILLYEGETYTEQGVNVGNGVNTYKIGEVKTNIPGTYIIRYIAIDSNNSINSVTRTIIIKPSEILSSLILAQNSLKSNPHLDGPSTNCINISDGNSNCIEIDEPGLYQSNATNSGATTYYFRGNVSNNYVSFAGQVWQIVRINEDGTVRLILNNPINNNALYLYGNNNLYSNSDIKGYIDTWFNTTITGSDLEKVATGNYFCQDEETLDFKCDQSKLLNLSVGTISKDEVVYSGGYYSRTRDQSAVSASNLMYFLRPSTGKWYWTMTPTETAGYVWFVDTGTNITVDNVSYQASGVIFPRSGTSAVRPVINLTGDTKAIISSTTGYYIIQ